MAHKTAESQPLPAKAGPVRALGHPTVQKALPWLAGAGMALGHAAVSANCTVPQQGRCAACGSCILVVGSLVAWAMAKKARGDDFYIEG
jgi:hypothetical protein